MKESSVDRPVGGARSPSRPGDDRTDGVVGSAEHLRNVFERAAAAAGRAVGMWLERSATAAVFADRADPSASAYVSDIRALRALVRAAATAYARNLRQANVTPERMVVLVKQATGGRAVHGFAVQELTSDVVLWSIEAYFDD